MNSHKKLQSSKTLTKHSQGLILPSMKPHLPVIIAVLSLITSMAVVFTTDTNKLTEHQKNGYLIGVLFSGCIIPAACGFYRLIKPEE
jgi:hypothetical protein